MKKGIETRQEFDTNKKQDFSLDKKVTRNEEKEGKILLKWKEEQFGSSNHFSSFLEGPCFYWLELNHSRMWSGQLERKYISLEDSRNILIGA